MLAISFYLDSGQIESVYNNIYFSKYQIYIYINAAKFM